MGAAATDAGSWPAASLSDFRRDFALPNEAGAWACDIANVERGIEQLKTSQEQMTRYNAKAAEQLNASHENMPSPHFSRC
jgi:hypothetical protein